MPLIPSPCALFAACLIAGQAALAQSTSNAPSRPTAKAKARAEAPVPAVAEPRESSIGGGKSGGKRLTRDELRACLGQQDELRRRRGGFETEQAALDSARAGIDGTTAALQAEAQTLDRTNKELVDAYNDKVQQRERQIDEWNGRKRKLVADAEAWTAAQGQWKDACAGRPYLEDDEVAIRNGR